jgi:sigma-B regulation protein RsbU (phosphoserine phosphatase)
MNIKRKLWPEALRSKSGIAIIVTVAVLLELISTIQFFYARKGIREDVQHRAESELHVKSLEIRKVMVSVETCIENSVWAIEESLDQPDSLYTVLRRLVKQNKTIVGAGAMFTPGYYPQKGRWFEPYVAERPDHTIEEAQIGSASHNYLEADFYKDGMKAGKGHWSEPYFDEAGARMMLCTYTTPVRDKSGQVVALFGADVSLDWLSSVINSNNIFPSSFNVVISRTGKVMACPDESLIMRSTIQEVTASSSDTTTRYINQQQMSGKSGHQDIRDFNGEKVSVFYAPVEGEAGWSMSVVCADKEIYAGLRRVIFYLTLLMIAGMVLLGYIIYRAARNIRSLQKADAEKERIGSELRIARSIQESMLPKTFPPYPERADVDIYASLVPAKEVGGDLYDFHIRNEKLFFCIGDVSGKGVPASLVMAVTRSLFRSVTVQEEEPGTILSMINDAISDMNDSGMFVTLFLGVLDLKTGLLRFCNAGHEDPLLIGKGVGLLPTNNNIPLGVMPSWNYESQEAVIYPHTTIFLYTDGLTEAEDKNRAQFGNLRMTRIARQALLKAQNLGNTCDPKTIIALETKALHLFVGNAEKSDDLTMLAVQYTPQS